jgi:uncharacterized protein YceH (UPF0502 family)
MQLTDIELRVLGVLMEKSLAVPDSYPMTLNSIVLGANQKQNREPVTEYLESDVARALHALQVKNLVKLAPPAAGARANRFQHNVVEVFHWDKREQAIVAELMLRGRQTPGELRTHASRMTPLDDLPAVLAVLDALSKSQPPYVEELPREPGRSANRYRHLLWARDTRETVGDPSPVPTIQGTPTMSDRPSLDVRVAALEDRVAELEKQLVRPPGNCEALDTSAA